jgi:hypothetical protein
MSDLRHGNGEDTKMISDATMKLLHQQLLAISPDLRDSSKKDHRETLQR